MKKLFVILALLSFATACQGFGGTWAFGPWTSGESLIDPGLDQSPFWDDSAGRMAWGPVPTPTLPGGSDTEVQYNNSGAFGGDPTFTFDDTTKILDVDGQTITGTTAIGLDMSSGTFATAIQKWPAGTIQSTGDIVFQPTSDGTTRYQWLDAVDDKIILNIDTSSKRVGFCTEAPLGLVDAASGLGLAIVLGADTNAITRTNNTEKFGRVGMPHYDLSEEEILLFTVRSDGTDNFIQIGGGTTTANAATKIDIYTGPTDTTVDGVLIARFDENGNFTIGNRGVRLITITRSRLHVYGPEAIISVQNENIFVGNTVGIRFKGTKDDTDNFFNAGMMFERTNEEFSTGGKLHLVMDATSTGNVDVGDAKVTLLQGGNLGFNETAPETLLELTHAQPYLTLHNSTHEDTDGGRESRVIAKGEKADGTEHTLAITEVGHDGTGDDYDAYWKLSLNATTGGVDTLIDRFKLDDVGATIYSADASDTIRIFHTNDSAFIRYSDGVLTVQTEEGTNTNTSFEIKGNGTGFGALRVFDEDNAESIVLTAQLGQAYMFSDGTSPSFLNFQHRAEAGIRCFSSAAEGETEQFQVHGFGTGFGGKEFLAISIERFAANTAEFMNVPNYMFGGNLITKNFTHSDADDAGATSWTAKRERSGGEETESGTITMSHDGIGDDQLAKLVLGVNTGAGVVDIIEIDSSGNTKIGDAGVTDYTQFSIIGDQTFVGTAGFYPRRVSQSAIPAAGTGSTQVDTGEFMVWRDSDDAKIYLLYNDTDSGIKSIEML